MFYRTCSLCSLRDLLENCYFYEIEIIPGLCLFHRIRRSIRTKRNHLHHFELSSAKPPAPGQTTVALLE